MPRAVFDINLPVLYNEECKSALDRYEGVLDTHRRAITSFRLEQSIYVDELTPATFTVSCMAGTSNSSSLQQQQHQVELLQSNKL